MKSYKTDNYTLTINDNIVICTDYINQYQCIIHEDDIDILENYFENNEYFIKDNCVDKIILYLKKKDEIKFEIILTKIQKDKNIEELDQLEVQLNSLMNSHFSLYEVVKNQEKNRLIHKIQNYLNYFEFIFINFLNTNYKRINTNTYLLDTVSFLKIKKDLIKNIINYRVPIYENLINLFTNNIINLKMVVNDNIIIDKFIFPFRIITKMEYTEIMYNEFFTKNQISRINSLNERCLSDLAQIDYDDTIEQLKYLYKYILLFYRKFNQK